MLDHRNIIFHSLHIANVILDKDLVEVNMNVTEEEKITQTILIKYFKISPFTCLFAILHKKITMASALSVHVSYVTRV